MFIFYTSKKCKKIGKLFYVQKAGHFVKSKTISLRFICKNIDTLRYATFHETFEVVTYIKKHDTLRYVALLYTKSRQFAKSKKFCVTMLYTKSQTLCITQFFMKFLKLAEWGGHFYMQKNAL